MFTIVINIVLYFKEKKGKEKKMTKIFTKFPLYTIYYLETNSKVTIEPNLFLPLTIPFSLVAFISSFFC